MSGREGAVLCPRCGSRFDRIRISPGCGARRGCGACGTWEDPESRSREIGASASIPFAPANLIVACPLRARTVFSAGTELYQMIKDGYSPAAPRREVAASGQASIIMVRGDLAALWVEVDASFRPRIALGISPGGLDLEEASAERKCRVVGLFASATRDQGMSLFDRTITLLTPARLRRLRRARDTETVRRILRDSPRGRSAA